MENAYISEFYAESSQEATKRLPSGKILKRVEKFAEILNNSYLGLVL